MEHKYAVKTGNWNNGVAIHIQHVHACSTWHRVNWDGTEILELENNYWKRGILEAIWIEKTTNNSNLDCSLTFNQTSLPYIHCKISFFVLFNHHFLPYLHHHLLFIPVLFVLSLQSADESPWTEMSCYIFVIVCYMCVKLK